MAVWVGAGLRRNSGFVDDGRAGVLVEIFLRNAIERERRNRLNASYVQGSKFTPEEFAKHQAAE